MTLRPFELPVHHWLPEPELLFDPDSIDARDIHPLRGLARFGPYSEHVLGSAIQPLRVACISTYDQEELFGQLLDEIEQKHGRAA